MSIKTESVFEPNDRIVSMVEHKGKIYVATECNVFRMEKDELTNTVAFEPVVFHIELKEIEFG